MIVQFKKHKCANKPRSYDIEATSLDKKDTEWELIIREGSRNARFETRLFIKYCPYCGAKLEDE